MNHFLNAASPTLIDLIKDKDFDGIVALMLTKLPSLISAIIILIIGSLISKLIGKLVVKGMQAKGVDSSIHSFIKTIVMFVVNLIFVLSALSTLCLAFLITLPRRGALPRAYRARKRAYNPFCKQTAILSAPQRAIRPCPRGVKTRGYPCRFPPSTRTCLPVLAHNP